MENVGMDWDECKQQLCEGHLVTSELSRDAVPGGKNDDSQCLIKGVVTEFLVLALEEQDITGDILLDLDVNILKSSIGIAAFGKCSCMVKAIAELHPPPATKHQVYC